MTSYASYPLEVYVVLFTNLDIYLMDLLAFNRQIGNVYVRQGVFVLLLFARSKVAELEPPYIFFIVVFWVVMLILPH